MELPMDLLNELDKFVCALDETDCSLDRHIAIRDVARLLIYLTHDEYYDIVDAFDKKYSDIADVCQHFTGM